MWLDKDGYFGGSATAMESDPLNSADFDPVAFINDQFPNEDSLTNLDNYVVSIASQINIVEKEISQTVQMHSLQRHQTSHDIGSALSQIEELSGKMSNIKNKASDSEQVVEEICSDIKKLDLAKTHLQTSITSLKRLQMLMMAVNKLETLAESDQHKATAEILDAVRVLMLNFQSYNTVPIILELRERVMMSQSRLKKQVINIFSDIGALCDGAGLAGAADALAFKTHLADSCALLDALGLDSRREILEDFVKTQLQPYEKLFGEGKAHFTLDQVERRWAWFKRLLKNIDDTYHTIFPGHWRMAMRMCLEFSEKTKIHLLLLLGKLDKNDEIDVHALLKALKATLRFEQEMVKRFELDKYLTEASRGEEEDDDDDAMRSSDMRLGDEDKLMYVPTNYRADEQAREDESGFLKAAATAIIGTKGISGVFDKFLGTYVELERQNLEEMIARINGEQDAPHELPRMAGSDGDDEYDLMDMSEEEQSRRKAALAFKPHPSIFGSSLSIFTFIKNSIKRCTAFSTKFTFLSLSKEFRVCLGQYVELLKQRCPRERPVPSLFPADPRPAQVYKLEDGGELAMCNMINTGEYCADLVPSLEEMIKSKISPELEDKVDFSAEADGFMDLGAHSLKVLVSGILDRLRVAFSAMACANWTNIEEVVLENQYVNTVQSILARDIPIIRNGLSDSYFRTFCTRLTSDALDTFLDIIFHQRRISEMGAQQLLLDMYNVKTQLLNLHAFGPEDNSYRSSGVPAMYEKLVTGRFAQIEVVLKLVGTPEDEAMLVERFRIMWPDGKASDLEKIMNLKGVGVKSKQSILESFDISGLQGGAAMAAKSFTQGTSSAIQGAYQAASAASKNFT